MKSENHICFSKERYPALWRYILENNVKADYRDGEDIVAIDIYSTDPHWDWVGEYVEKMNVFCLRDIIYSKEELQQAQRLAVRTIWRYGYPEPQNDYRYVDITYDKTNYCTRCGIGLRQKDAFRMAKAPKWGRRHFYAPFWVEDELFISETAKMALENAKITGISFREVKNKKGSEYLPDTWQLYIEHKANPGLIPDEGYIQTVNICSLCGSVKYGATRENGSMQRFKKKAFDYAPDVVKTYEVFGGMHMVAIHEIIVSQKFYQTVADKNLDKSLRFYPIELVEDK